MYSKLARITILLVVFSLALAGCGGAGGGEGGGPSGEIVLYTSEPQENADETVAAFNELYPDIYHKAAALLESLVNNHPFVDGNKRTGITAAAMFLKINDLTLTASNQQVESFVLSVAAGKQEFESTVKWLKTYSR